jgi:hypothetical protein
MSYAAVIAKPEIFSFVFIVLLAWNWWDIRRAENRSWWKLYLFPLLMLLWVNSHGGFIFGVVFLACIGVGELLNTWLSPKNILTPLKRKHLVSSLVLSAFCLFLNPYGYHYLLKVTLDIVPSKENLLY